jgi:hypothetical protein
MKSPPVAAVDPADDTRTEHTPPAQHGPRRDQYDTLTIVDPSICRSRTCGKNRWRQQAYSPAEGCCTMNLAAARRMELWPGWDEEIQG